MEQVSINAIAEKKGIQISRAKIIREKTAGGLAIMITILFVILAITPIFKSSTTVYIKDILLCVSALVGAAFGFYFSEKRLD